MVDTETGELTERRLEHGNGEAKKFYAGLHKPVHVGMEATGYAQWFERMLAKLGHELGVGDAAEIRAAMVRKQKTDSRDALHILDLLLENRFPRMWAATGLSLAEVGIIHVLLGHGLSNGVSYMACPPRLEGQVWPPIGCVNSARKS